jgi:beta-galactosidase
MHAAAEACATEDDRTIDKGMPWAKRRRVLRCGAAVVSAIKLSLLMSLLVILSTPIAALGAALPSGASEFSGRQILSLDGGWRFLRSDATGAQETSYNDATWSRVSLPHTFNAEDGERGGPYYRGVAWYRRVFDLREKPDARRAYLQFDGAFLVTDVWVNGRSAGRHEGGFAAFRFDVTDLLKPGRNVIAVRVDSSPRKTVAPLGGDFTASGGLYRGVSLLWTEALHIDALDYGGPGVYARVDSLTADRAGISITSRLKNDSAMPVKAMVRDVILDQANRVVGKATSQVDLAPGDFAPVEQKVFIDHPRLWDGRKDPYLYRVVTTATSLGDDELRDRIEVPLGIRFFSMEPDRGFVLNGRSYPVHGVDYFHSGRPGRGLAIGSAQVDEDMAILDRLGVTGLRLVHFQHPQRAYDDADRLGLVLWTEIPLNSAVDSDPAFLANLKDQLRELIRQNYNHPSVVVWGLGNEVYKADATAAVVLDELQATAKTEDPTRPTTYADCCHPEDGPQASHTDVIGFNRYFGWYDGDFDEFGAWADATHRRLPNRAVAVSEYGAGASAQQQEDPPKRPVAASHWHPEQYQALWHEAVWRQLRDRRWLWGTFVWVAFDVVSSGRDEGAQKGLNDKGLVTLDRKTYKDAFYWYQANWSNMPMAHITSTRDVRRSQSTVDVKVYTNAASARLELNGRDLGAVAPPDHVAIWRGVRLQPGANRVEAIAGGVHDIAVWTYLPAARASDRGHK